MRQHLPVLSMSTFVQWIYKRTMIEKLSKRTTLFCSSCLCAIDRVKCLVQKKADGPREVDPGWTVLVETRIVVEESDEIDDHEAESAESDLSLCERSWT